MGERFRIARRFLLHDEICFVLHGAQDTSAGGQPLAVPAWMTDAVSARYEIVGIAREYTKWMWMRKKNQKNKDDRPTSPVVKELHAKIGQLSVENDFLSGALGKAGMLSAKR